MTRWTQREDTIVRKLWPDPCWTAGDIAAMCGRSRTATIGRAHRLGLRRPSERRSVQRAAWTAAEDAELERRWLAGESDRQIAGALGRLEGGVTTRRGTLGLRSPRAMGAALQPSDGARVRLNLGQTPHPPPAVRTSAQPGPPPSTCRWIEGEPTADAEYCGAPVAPGRSWCMDHCVRVFRKPARGEEKP